MEEYKVKKELVLTDFQKEQMKILQDELRKKSREHLSAKTALENFIKRNTVDAVIDNKNYSNYALLSRDLRIAKDIICEFNSKNDRLIRSNELRILINQKLINLEHRWKNVLDTYHFANYIGNPMSM